MKVKSNSDNLSSLTEETCFKEPAENSFLFKCYFCDENFAEQEVEHKKNEERNDDGKPVLLQCQCMVSYCVKCVKEQLATRSGTYQSYIECLICAEKSFYDVRGQNKANKLNFNAELGVIRLCARTDQKQKSNLAHDREEYLVNEVFKMMKENNKMGNSSISSCLS